MYMLYQGRRGSQIGPGKLYARGPLLGGGGKIEVWKQLPIKNDKL